MVENGGILHSLTSVVVNTARSGTTPDGQMNKQNVFDDFIIAGEYLISGEIYIIRISRCPSWWINGGSPVGALMTQRPDLMKVALPAVGVMDMLRYHKFTAGAGWKYDYGIADDSKEMFEYIPEVFTSQRPEAGYRYPATLITTADHDDRVVPSHSFKFAATPKGERRSQSAADTC